MKQNTTFQLNMLKVLLQIKISTQMGREPVLRPTSNKSHF